MCRLEIELLCDYPQWWRYNVYVMVVGFEQEGGEATFDHLVDEVWPAGSGEHSAPPDGYPSPRRIALKTRPCKFADLYIYIVANTFPATDSVRDWPPFAAELRVSADGKPIERITLGVDQLGGLTVAGHRVCC